MRNDAQAKNKIVAALLKWEIQNIRLRHPVPFADRKKISIGFDGAAQINRCYRSALREQHLGKASGATSAFQDRHFRQSFPQLIAEAPFHPVARDWHASERIELSLAIAPPLKPVMLRVSLGFHESGNAASDWERMFLRT
jgi:hypothetical protein